MALEIKSMIPMHIALPCVRPLCVDSESKKQVIGNKMLP